MSVSFDGNATVSAVGNGGGGGGGELSQMHKWFIVTGSLLALSAILGVIYFMITHRNCLASICSSLRADQEGERCRRQVLSEADDADNGQGQSRMSTHLFVNKWMSRGRSNSEFDKTSHA